MLIVRKSCDWLPVARRLTGSRSIPIGRHDGGKTLPCHEWFVTLGVEGERDCDASARRAEDSEKRACGYSGPGSHATVCEAFSRAGVREGLVSASIHDHFCQLHSQVVLVVITESGRIDPPWYSFKPD
jgi:hypothetical protein